MFSTVVVEETPHFATSSIKWIKSPAPFRFDFMIPQNYPKFLTSVGVNFAANGTSKIRRFGRKNAADGSVGFLAQAEVATTGKPSFIAVRTNDRPVRMFHSAANYTSSCAHADQSPVRTEQPLVGSGALQRLASQPASENSKHWLRIEAPIVAEGILVQIGLQIAVADGVVDTCDSPLHQAPESFDGISVNIARNVDLCAVVDAAVPTASAFLGS